MDNHSLLNKVSRPHKDSSYVVRFQVHYYGHHTIVKFEEFPRLCILKAVNTDNSVADLKDFSYFLEFQLIVHVPELA